MLKFNRVGRRGFLTLTGGVVTTAILAACGAPASPTAPPAKAPAAAAPAPAAADTKPAQAQAPAAAKPVTSANAVTVRYVTRGQPSASNFAPLWDEFQVEFTKRFPNIKVEIQPSPGASYQEQTVNQIVAGTAPDVMEQCCWQSTYFVQNGHTLNLQPRIQSDSAAVDLNDFYKYQFDAWRDAKNDIHLFPTYTGTMVVFYNKDWFTEKGVPFLPKNWDENIDLVKYAEIGNKFKESGQIRKWGSTNYGMTAKNFAWVVQMHLRGFGINMVDPANPNRAQLDDPKALQALELIRKWIHDDKWFAYGADSASLGGLNVQGLFNGGKVAMIEMGSWGLTNAVDGAKFKWDIAPQPKGPAGQTTHQSVDGAMIWKGTKVQDESWILIRESASAWNMRRKMKWGTQPSRKSVLADFPAELRKQNPIFNNVNLEVFAESFAKDIGRPEEMFAKNDKTCKDEILGPAFEQVMQLGKAPVDLIGKASKIVEKFNTGQVGIGDIGRELNAIGIN